MKTRVTLAIAALVVFVVHGIVFRDQFFNKWEKHQSAYLEQARSMAKTDAQRQAIDAQTLHIDQILVSGFGETRVDRCATCHSAIDDPRFQGHAQPLKAHPYSADLGDRQVNGEWQRRHKFADFGCTVCHGGQGRGLETKYAHGEDEFWPEPMLGYTTQENWDKKFIGKYIGKDFMQANCAQCHTDENFPGTALVTQGRRLFEEKGCYGCHRIEGLSYGTLGPDLTEVGKKFKINYLWEHTVNPRAFQPTSFMPKFDLTDEQLKALVIFLKSRRGMNFAETQIERFEAHLQKTSSPVSSAAATATVSPARGEELIAQKACTSCHKLGDKDGHISPNLDYEGLVRDNDWLMAHFKDPRSRIPDSIMPSFPFVEADFQSMAAYLGTRNTPPHFNTAEETYKGLCARCHGENGDGKGPIWLYIDPAPRDLTKAAFMTSKPEDRFLTSLKNGVPGTSMPPWARALTDDQRKAVLDYIFTAFVKQPRKVLEHKVPDTDTIGYSAESVTRGEQIFLARCTGCHGRKADGKGPNSLDISPRPRNLRNRAFLDTVSDHRLYESILYGVQGSAMPSWIDYGLTQNDVGDIINFIHSLNKPSSAPAKGDKTAKLTSQLHQEDSCQKNCK